MRIIPGIQCFLVFFVYLAVCSSVSGADKYKKGEKIEVFYFDAWHPAVVVEVNSKGMVKAEHEFAGETKEDMFKPDACRHEYEFGAIWRGRTWTDRSGKNKIKASLLRVEPKKVFLRTEELKEMSIELEKLSDTDKKFIQKLRESAGFGGSVMSVKSEAVRFDIESIARIDGAARSFERVSKPTASDLKLSPDPLRAGMKMTQAGALFGKVVFGDGISGIIPLGGEDKWILASIQNTFPEKAPTRLVWTSLGKGKVESMHVLPSSEALIDYHAGSKQALTVATPKGWNSGDHDPILTIWKTTPTAKEAEAVISWRARFNKEERWGHADPWARFITGSRVLQRDSDHRLVMWDISAKSAVWTTPQESFFAPDPVLSHNGKYLFVPEDSHLRIMNPETGSVLGIVKMPSSCSGVALHPDGRTLAIVSATRIVIVDITGETPLKDLDATGTGSPFQLSVFWVSDSLLAVGGATDFTLFNVDVQVPLWRYEFDPMSVINTFGSTRAKSIVDGHLVYGVAKRDAADPILVFGAVSIPEKAVLDKLTTVDRKKYMLLGKNASVRLSVNAGQSNSEVQAAVERQIQNNGWKVNTQSQFLLEAKIYTAPTQTVRYENRTTGEVTSVQATPIVSTLTLYRDTETIWSSSTSTGFPPMLFLREGTSIQQEVSKAQQADVGFFSRTEIPIEVLDPKLKTGIGTSEVTIKGLIPKTK